MAVPKRVATEPRTAVSSRTTSKVSRKTGAVESSSIPNNNRFAPGLVGARLRERRLERGITLRQFARDIDVSASFISQLETGKALPTHLRTSVDGVSHTAKRTAAVENVISRGVRTGACKLQVLNPGVSLVS